MNPLRAFLTAGNAPSILSSLMSTPRPLLLLGGSSYVGQALVRRLGPSRVLATHCKTPFPGSQPFDVRSDSVRALCAPGEVSHALILLGNTSPNACLEDEAASWSLNVTAILRILLELRELGIVPVFTSTESVFDGERGGYSEADSPKPLMTYARQKVVIEEFLAACLPESVVVRLGLVYSSEPHERNLLSRWAKAIGAGQEELTGAHDYVCSPVHVDDVAEGLLALIERDARGLFHLGGPEALSRCDMLDLLLNAAARCGLKPPTLRRCSMKEFEVPEPRPLDCSLRSAKLIARTGLAPRSLGSALDECAESLFNAYLPSGDAACSS